MELAELIEAVKATDPDTFKEALHKGSQPHFQALFNAGHSAATAAAKTKQKEFDDQVATLNASIEELQGQLKSKDDEIAQVSAKTPDLDKIKTDYEQKLIAKDEKIKEAQAAAEKRESELKQQMIAKEKSRVRQSLINKIQGLHADPWAAERAVDESIMSRIDIDLEGNMKVFQADRATPFMPAEGQTALDLLAHETLSTIPKALIRPPKNNGSNYQGDGGGQSNSSTKKRSEFSRTERIDFINEHGREAYEALPM